MKILKKLFYLIILVILLLAVGTFLATRFINPNNYKDKITAMVHEKTGRDLTIQGQIELSFFPWIGLRVHGVQLSNAAGFQPNNFASVGEADVRVKLLPLLSRQIEIGKVTLLDLTVNLAKNKEGVTNWQDLTARSTSNTAKVSTTTTTTQSTATGLVFSVAGINIENANVSWVDAQKGRNVTLKNVQVKSDHPAIGHSFPFSFTGDLNSNNPDKVGHFSFKSDILANLEGATYQLKNLHVVFSPEKAGPALSLQANTIGIDLHAQTFSVPDAVISDGDLNVKLQLQGQQILDKPVFTGQLQAVSLNLKNTLKILGKSIVTTDPNALQKVSLSSQFTGTASSINLQPLTLNLDSSTIKGSFAVTDFATKALHFDLAIDQLNVDNYLPPASASHPVEGTPATTATATAAVSTGAQPNAMRHNVNGSLHIGKLTAGKMLLEQISAQIALNNGVLHVDPFSANIYKGSMQGKIAVDFQGAAPKYVIDETLTNIDMTELVKSGRLTGRGNITTHVTLQGEGKAAMMRSLNGNIQFNIQNGALTGVNIPYQIERAVAVFKREALPKETSEKQTRFDVLKGTGTFTNGLFSNNDLSIQSTQFKATGAGTANFATETLDYRLQFVGLHTVTNAQGNTLQEEHQTTIPVMITGTFDKPIITPDLKVLFQSEAGQRLVGKVQQRLEQRLGPGTGGAVGGVLQRLLER